MFAQTSLFDISAKTLSARLPDILVIAIAHGSLLAKPNTVRCPLLLALLFNTTPYCNMGNWFVIDLTAKHFGRAASLIAKLLNARLYNAYGKRACACKLLLVNSSKLLISKRLLKKRYWHHSGYPGGLKLKLASQFDINTLFIKVLAKMLPNTRMKRILIGNVRLFKDSNVGLLAKRALYLDI
ncbi:MAG: uL13 family ribosomal protein [Candidatus Hodgkinia cicadicola]